MLKALNALGTTLFDRRQDVGDDFVARLGAEIALAVNAQADGIRFHVTVSDHEHGVNLHLLGALDLAIDLVGRCIDFGAHFLRAQLVQDGAGVFEQRRFIADGQNANLLRARAREGNCRRNAR